MAQLNRSITKLYKKTNCLFDCMPAIVIATTTITINEKLNSLNAKESEDIDYFAISDCNDLDDEVHVLKTFTTNMLKVECDDCSGDYYLVLVEMTEEMHMRELNGMLSFSLCI